MGYPYLIGLPFKILRGFTWDIPILIFAYVLFWGPKAVSSRRLLQGSESEA